MHKARQQFKGVIAATVTPYTKEGGVNEEAFRRILESNIQDGVDGFWITGGTGEGVFLTDDERIRMSEVAVDQVKGRAKVISHVGAFTTRSAARIAEGARKAGVDAIASIPPMFYRPSDEAIVRHYRMIADAAGDLPLFLYNIPHAVGYEMMPPTIEKLIEEVPQLAGVKYSVLNPLGLRTLAKTGLTLFIGFCEIFLPALDMGAAGTVDGFQNVYPKPFVETYRAFLAGDGKRAAQAQEEANRFTDLIWKNAAFSKAYHHAFKVMLGARLGIDLGGTRAPLLELTESQQRELLKGAREVGVV